METLQYINKSKVRFALKIVTMGWAIIVISVLAVISFTKNFPVINVTTISIFALFLFSIPILFYALLYGDLCYRQRISEAAFATAPLNQLSNLGFNPVYVNEEPKWLWTEIAWRGKINEFRIDAFVKKDLPDKVVFIAPLKLQQIDPIRYKKLSTDFKVEDMEFDLGGVSKSYKIKNISHLEIADLEKSLLEFTELLKKEYFEPA